MIYNKTVWFVFELFIEFHPFSFFICDKVEDSVDQVDDVFIDLKEISSDSFKKIIKLIKNVIFLHSVNLRIVNRTERDSEYYIQHLVEQFSVVFVFL